MREEMDDDKSRWGPGAWQTEPDKIEWEAHGLPCLAVRGPVGAWCGYAAVPPGHPLHGISYSSCFLGCGKRKKNYVTQKQIGRAKRGGDLSSYNLLKTLKAMEHSGFYRRYMKKNPRFECDYSSNHSPESIVKVHGGLTYSGFCQGKICHVPKPGEPDNVFWFGFDCSHAGDLSPKLEMHMSSIPGFKDSPFEYSEIYRDVEYIKAETTRLAKQLASMKYDTLRLPVSDSLRA